MWYEYLTNQYLTDILATAWTDYSIAIGLVSGLIGFVVRQTKTKRDDEIWEDFKALLARRKKGSK